MCLFQLFVASTRLEILFSNEPAGASSSRSATSRKNKFQNFEAFHYYLGQKKLIRWYGYSFSDTTKLSINQITE